MNRKYNVHFVIPALLAALVACSAGSSATSGPNAPDAKAGAVGAPLNWDRRGYYEVSLDAQSLSWTQ